MSRRPHPRHVREASQRQRLRLYGRHAVHAALDNSERTLRKLYATHETAAELAIPKGLQVELGDAADLARLVPADAPHQGLVLECEPLESPWLGDILDFAEAGKPLLVLDQVTDPHNVGAILRSAAAFGAVGVVTQDRHAPPETGALAKAASGALETVKWARVVNLARALEEIADAGFWRIGLTGHALVTLDKALGETRPALILGAEGDGMRHNIAEHCDELARLPISGAVESLNVSNAAAVALYAAVSRG